MNDHVPTGPAAAKPGDDAAPARECAYDSGGASWRAQPLCRRSFFRMSLVAAGIAAAFGLAEDAFGEGGGAPLSAFGNLGAAQGPSLPPADPEASVYSISSLTELSEDLFLVQNHPIDPAKDTVVSYSRADGQVEAVVLQGGVVTQIYRDPTQPGGWNTFAFPYADGVVSMVAGVSGPVVIDGRPQGAAALKIFYTTKASPGVLNVAVETTPPADGHPPVFQTKTVSWSTNALAQTLQLAVNHDESLLVTAMVPSPTQKGAQLWYWTDGVTSAFESAPPLPVSTGSLTGFGFFPTAAPGSWAAVVGQDETGSGVPTIFLWLPGVGVPASPKPVVGVYAAVLDPGTHTNVAVRDLSVAYNAVPSPGANAVVTGIASLNPLGAGLLPSALVWVATALPGANPTSVALWTLSNDNVHKTWHWTSMSLPPGLDPAVPPPLATAIRPSPDASGDGVAATRLLDTFVLMDETASIIRQAATGDGDADIIAPQYTPYLPFQTDVAMVVSQASTSTGNELLYVQKSTGLLVSLERDPVSGRWSDHLVHLPSEELQQANTYRVSLTLADQWGRVLPATALSVTASTAALANVNDQVVTLGDAPYAFSTDAQGRAEIVILADGLSAATLTVSGAVLGTRTAVIDPSDSVNGYFTGAAPLNYLDPMSVSTLQGAQDDSGAALAPGASDAAEAQDAVTNMNYASTWGAAGVAGAASSTLGGGGTAGTIASETVGDIDQWAHDVLHAIKSGATKVTDVARDVAGKAFTITCDLTGWAGKALRIVVKTIEDAAHVLHAVLRKLLADILKVIKWLAAEVVELLKDSWALAQQYQAWLTDCTGLMSATLASGRGTVDRWLNGKREWLESGFSDFLQKIDPHARIGDTSSSSVSASRQAGPVSTDAAAGHGAPVFRSAHGSWLIGKVLNLIGGSLQMPPDNGLLADLSQFVKAAEDEALAFFDVYRGFWQFVAGSIVHPSDISDLLYRDILLQLEKLLDTTLTFIQKFVDMIFDMFSKAVGGIATVLGTKSLETLGLLGKLLELVGIKGPSLLDVITLIFAFPATLAYKLDHKGQGRPFASPAATRQAPGGVSAASEVTDLQACAGSALGVWAVLDTISAAISSDKDADPSKFFAAVDFAAPLIVGCLTVPATSADGRPYYSWPVNGTTSGQLNFLSWFVGLLPALASLSSLIATDDEKGGDEDEDETSIPFAVMTCCFGVLSTVSGCVGNHYATSEKDSDYFEDVLNNIAYDIAPLLLKDVIEASEGTSAIIATGLTLVCGETGAILTGIEG